MKLEIEITPVEKFEVKIGGEIIGEFTKESSWEGMAKLVSTKGEILVVEDGSNFVDKLFAGILGVEKQSSYTVIKMSPSLVPTNGID